MAHQRTLSAATADTLKEPHSVSLKVLRLSRPSFAVQHPLPIPSPSSDLAQLISPAASAAYPSKTSQDPSDAFMLSPLLTLPPAFGNAYVGETFACTLCANNELSADAQPARLISGVRIEAEMKSPSTTVPLQVAFASDQSRSTGAGGAGENGNVQEIKDGRSDNGRDLASGQTLQGIVDFHLKEEGDHVLAITISYTETGATSGRVRSFRKLYKFAARSCLVVRTKIGPLPEAKFRSSGSGTEVTKSRRRWALEAQLENCGEEIIVLDMVTLDEKPWCKATGLNWEGEGDRRAENELQNPILACGDVQQVCFLVEQRGDEGEQEVDASGRLVMGVLSIGWRGPMGNRCSLSTGLLGTRLR